MLCGVDIASADHHHDRPASGHPALEQGGDTHCSGALEHQSLLLIRVTQAIGDGGFVEQMDLVEQALGEGEGVAVVQADTAAEGVGQGRQFLHLDRVAGLQTGVHGRAAVHADAVGGDGRVDAFDGQGDAGEQTTAGKRYKHLGDLGQLFEDFQAQGALACDHVRVVERRNQRRALFLGMAQGGVLGVVLGMADDAYFGA